MDVLRHRDPSAVSDDEITKPDHADAIEAEDLRPPSIGGRVVAEAREIPAQALAPLELEVHRRVGQGTI